MVAKKRPVKRKAASGASAVQTPSKSVKRGFVRGKAGRETVDVELKRSAERKAEREKQRNQPFRFRMRPGEEGREVVVLDDNPDFFMYEHTLKNPATGFWNLHLSCCQVFDDCAVCNAHEPASYNMVLTVLDLEPYTSRAGAEVPYSRKLFIVKSKQHKKFLRTFTKNGTLRGAVFILSRDDDKSPVIGSDIEFDGFLPEEDLAEYVRSYTDREGKEHVEDCSVPFDYDELFDEPDPELLRKHAGAGNQEAPEGSRQSNESAPMQPTPERRSRRARVADAVEEEEESFEDSDGSDVPWEDDAGEEAEDVEFEEVDEEEEEDAEEEAEEEEGDEDEEEEAEEEEVPAPAKKARRTRTAAPRKASPRKASPRASAGRRRPK